MLVGFFVGDDEIAERSLTQIPRIGDVVALDRFKEYTVVAVHWDLRSNLRPPAGITEVQIEMQEYIFEGEPR